MRLNLIKKLLIPLILIAICCFDGQHISSQVGTVTVDDKFKVAVYVSVSDEHRHKIRKAEIESYIKRELRSLKDVRIVAYEYPGTWKYSISIFLFATQYKDSTYTGHAVVNYEFLEKVDNRHFNDYWKDFHKKYPAFYLPQSSTANWQIDNLDNLCKKMVAKFDTNKLEKVREAREKR